jgi:hypothetical protein
MLYFWLVFGAVTVLRFFSMGQAAQLRPGILSLFTQGKEPLGPCFLGQRFSGWGFFAMFFGMFDRLGPRWKDKVAGLMKNLLVMLLDARLLCALLRIFRSGCSIPG